VYLSHADKSIECRAEDYFMKNVFYVIAVILITGWLIGIFFYAVVGIVETLLVLAVIAFLIQSARKPKSINPDSAAVRLNKKHTD